MNGLKYGGVPEEEREVVIRLDGKDRQAHVNSTWAEWSRKLEKLHGSPKKYQERNGVVVSAFWTIPLNAVSLRRPRRRAPMSETQRAAARDRIRRLRQILSPASRLT